MNHRSRLVPLAAMIAVSTTPAFAQNATTGAAKPFASFDAGDAYQPQPNGAKKQGQGQRPTAKKQVVIGDQPKDGQAQFGTAHMMPAYVEPAAAKKAPNAHVHHRGSTSQFGGMRAKNHHHHEVGVLDLVAAGAKQHGYTATLRS